MQRAQIEWVKKDKNDWITLIMKELKNIRPKKRFSDLNTAMQQYFLVTGRQLKLLLPNPVLSDFYVPSEDHHNCELAFITLSVIGIGALLWYSDQ